MEQVAWTVHVTDRETGQPIDAGEGRIFASSRDGKNIANGFAKLEEVGAYRTTLFFITAGTWAMGIQFRRDSAAVLERTQDWTQDVRTGDEPGDFTLPSSRIPTARQDSAADSLPPNYSCLSRPFLHATVSPHFGASGAGSRAGRYDL
jgi:hypothetical protein